jgi:hypothetical protein
MERFDSKAKSFCVFSLHIHTFTHAIEAQTHTDTHTHSLCGVVWCGVVWCVWWWWCVCVCVYVCVCVCANWPLHQVARKYMPVSSLIVVRVLWKTPPIFNQSCNGLQRPCSFLLSLLILFCFFLSFFCKVTGCYAVVVVVVK